MPAFDWIADYNIDPTDTFPLAVIATGKQVRDEHKTLEEA